MEGSKNIKYWIHLAITVAIMFLFGFIPAPAPITHYGMQILGIFIALVYGWCFCDLAWPSLLALAAIGITSYGTTQNVFTAVFGNANWFIMIMGFLMFAPLTRSGLAERIGMFLIANKMTKGKPILFFLIVCLASFLLSIFINGMVVCIFFVQILTTVFTQMGYQKGDRMVAMFLTAVMFNSAAASAFLSFYGLPLVIFGMVASVGITLSNPLMYSLYVFLVSLLCTILWIVVMKLVKCDFSKLQNANMEQYEKVLQTPMNKEQKALSIIMILFIAALLIVGMFGNAAGGPIRAALNNIGVYGVLAITLAIMIMVPVNGRPLLNLKEAASSVGWDFAFMLGIALFMASVLISEATGIGAFVLGIVSPILYTLGEFWFLMLIGIVVVVLTNLANNMVVIMTFVSIVMVMISQGLPINGLLATIIIMFCGLTSGVLLPSSSIAGALIYGNDLTDSKSALFQGVAFMLLFLVLTAAVIIPLGQIMLG